MTVVSNCTAFYFLSDKVWWQLLVQNMLQAAAWTGKPLFRWIFAHKAATVLSVHGSIWSQTWCDKGCSLSTTLKALSSHIKASNFSDILYWCKGFQLKLWSKKWIVRLLQNVFLRQKKLVAKFQNVTRAVKRCKVISKFLPQRSFWKSMDIWGRQKTTDVKQVCGWNVYAIETCTTIKIFQAVPQ